MIDPNVIEAVRKLARAVKAATRSAPEPGLAYCDAAEIEAEMTRLLAAEKPAAPATPALPWVVRDTTTGHVFTRCATREHAEYVQGWVGPTRCEVVEVAPAAPAIVPPAICAALSLPDDATAEEACRAIARLKPPAIVPVRFGPGGDALDANARVAERHSDGWEGERVGDIVVLRIALRPGEDAGLLTAKIVAAAGRSA